MKQVNNGRVEDQLEGLVQKIEKLNRSKIEEFEESRRALASMDRLIEAMAKLENQKKREKVLSRRIAHVHERLERTTGANRGFDEVKNLSVAFHKLLGGAKTTGQIIEIVAGSLQVMIETIRAVVKSQPTATRGTSTAGESRGMDLAALLKPINILLTSLVSKSQSSSPAPEESKSPEVVEGQSYKKDEAVPVPVVKAVPAAAMNQSARENK